RHRPNTAVAQAVYNAKEGVRRLATETGAGQWGSSLAFAGSLFGLEVTVYMVRISYEQKPYRRSMMQTWGAKVFASPTDKTNAGRGILAKDPRSNGSLGIAISEAVEDAATHDDTKYSLGSVLNHVCMPPGIHAGGLRYHGAAPLVSRLLHDGLTRLWPIRSEHASKRRSHSRARRGSFPRRRARTRSRRPSTRRRRRMRRGRPG